MQMNDSTSLNPARSGRGWSRRSLVASLVVAPVLVALTACSGEAPTPPTKPTVQAAATQVVAAASPAAATIQAAASPAMATAQAAASPALATAQAGASPAAATGAAVVATTVTGILPLRAPVRVPARQRKGQGTIRIADATISDSTPWLSIQNSSEEPIPLGGWKLQVGQATAQLPADAVVQPGAALTLHAGTGLSSDDELFLGNAGDALAAAAMPGTPVDLTDAEGKVRADDRSALLEHCNCETCVGRTPGDLHPHPSGGEGRMAALP